MTAPARRPPDEPPADRLPPQSLDSETAVLGSILIDQTAIAEVMDFLSDGGEDFYRRGHGLIYSAMVRLYKRGVPADIVTLSEELERAGELAAVGGSGYLSTLGSDTPTSVQAAQYAKLVQRKAVLRRLIGAAGKIAAIGYEDGNDVEEAIERATTELARVRLVDRAISKDFRLEKRGLGYLITWPDQQVELAFSKLKHRSSDVTADVLITCTLPGLNLKGSQLSMGRQNLSAPKGRMDFARTLQRRTHDEGAQLIDWEDVIERSYVEILIAEARGEPIVDIDGWNEAPEFRAYALDPIAPRGEPTVLYAPGGTGKSYLSLALALSIQLGREIVPGIPPAMTGPVLYLDWETNAKTVKYRIRKIATGMGFDPPRIAYRRCTAPLADDAEQLSVEIAKRGTVLVVIDSAGAAIGSMGDYGDANEGALRFFEAIRALGSDLTVIVIDHVKKPVFTKRGGPAPSDGPYGCYAADTEVLTRNGWLTHDRLDPETDVLAFDPETTQYRWERPTAYHAYPFAGELHQWSTKVSNALVTPNHRMIVSPGWPSAIGSPWRFVQADQITSADWLLAASGESPDEPGAAVDRDWATFLGWYIAEGSASGSAVRMGVTEPFASRMRPLLRRLFPDGWEKTYQRPGKPITHFVINGQPELVARLRTFGVDAGSKFLPPEVFRWALPQQRLLLDALMEGDGHQNGPAAWTYATKSERLADDVQRLAILLGLHADVHLRLSTYKGAPYRSYHVSITEKRSTWFRPDRASSLVPYEGMVYCLTVPSGAYVTRLDGRMAIHGNSVYKVNAARSVWELREAARGEDDVTCSLRHAKVNDSKIYRPITYRLVWSPEGQAPETATFETADYVAEVGSRQGASVADRALEAIGSGRMSTSMIAQLLGASIDTVRRSLNRDSRFVRMGSDWLSAENAPIPMNQPGTEQ